MFREKKKLHLMSRMPTWLKGLYLLPVCPKNQSGCLLQLIYLCTYLALHNFSTARLPYMLCTVHDYVSRLYKKGSNFHCVQVGGLCSEFVIHAVESSWCCCCTFSLIRLWHILCLPLCLLLHLYRGPVGRRSPEVSCDGRNPRKQMGKVPKMFQVLPKQLC